MQRCLLPAIVVLLGLQIFPLEFAAQTPTVDELITRMENLKKETEKTKEEVRRLKQQAEQEKAAKVKHLQRQEREARAAKRAASASRRKKKGKKSQEPIASNPELLKFPKISQSVPRVVLSVNPLMFTQQPVIQDDEKTKAILIAERNALAAKIARANRRWHCKFLRIGCIGRK